MELISNILKLIMQFQGETKQPMGEKPGPWWYIESFRIEIKLPQSTYIDAFGYYTPRTLAKLYLLSVVCIRPIFRVLPDWVMVGLIEREGVWERTAEEGRRGGRGAGGEEKEEKEREEEEKGERRRSRRVKKRRRKGGGAKEGGRGKRAKGERREGDNDGDGEDEWKRKDRRKNAQGETAHLFTCSYNFLQVIFRGESLHRC